MLLRISSLFVVIVFTLFAITIFGLFGTRIVALGIAIASGLTADANITSYCDLLAFANNVH